MAPVPSFTILYFIPLSVVVKSVYGSSSSADTGVTPERPSAATEAPAVVPTKDRRSTEDFDDDDDDMEREKAVAAVPATAKKTSARRVIFILWVRDRRKGLDMPTAITMFVFGADDTTSLIGSLPKISRNTTTYEKHV
jgi:hypothetical protein